MAEPLVTVVVLNWNGAHLLGDCLRGLAAQDLPEGQLAYALLLVEQIERENARLEEARRS